jgi:hypothetical protein
VLHRLTDLGNTVIIIEHNLDVIRNADWILDLGPEGGEDGGHIVAEGTPEYIASVANSYTGKFLRSYYTHTGEVPLAPLTLPIVEVTQNGNRHASKAKTPAAKSTNGRKRKPALVR